MSTVNVNLLKALGQLGFAVLDNVEPGPASTQATATPISAEAVRVTKSVANGSLSLKSVLGVDAPPMVFVINDSANTIVVYCAPANNGVNEKHNGTNNANLSVAAGASAVFVRADQSGGGPDWRSAAIT
jgi:uncharacterized NAD(P)/FAD-binding protein YdhS